MAEAVHLWIASYLISIAEQHGANMPSIPYFQRGKKVQLIEWLTYGNNNDDSLLWAKISDKQHVIPIRFSNKAIAEYNRLNIHKRITQHKTAVIIIKNFKPFFARVPRGGNMKLSSHCVLAIDCDSVSLLASFDEARFGNPTEVETNSDIRLWSEGLRQDGGGGNVLKQRKDAKAVLDPVPPAAVSIPPKIPVTAPAPKTRNPPSNEKSLISNGHRKTNQIDLLRKHEHLFPRFIKEQPRRIPSSLDDAGIGAIPVQQDTNDCHTACSDPYDELQQQETHATESPCEQRRTFPHIPDTSHHSQKIQSRESSPGIPFTDWSPSPPPAPRKPCSPPPVTSWTVSFTQTSSVPSSQPDAPTPAQRQKGRIEALPPSSPPPEFEVIAHETVLLPSLPSHDRYTVIRKVLRPPQPAPPNQSDSGLTQILVPNSDTSLPYSQSQPQSHSLSQEVPESSQPVILSQLSALSKPRKDLDAIDAFVNKSDSANAGDGRDVAAGKSSLSSFSGRFNEDASYEGDYSSLEPANEQSPRRKTYQNGCISSPHSTSSPHGNNKGPTGVSMIPQPTVTQQQATEIRSDNIDGDDAPVVSQVQYDAVLNHMAIAVTQKCDEDDAQIHRELFGPSYVSQSRDSSQRHPPGEYIPDPPTSDQARADPNYSQLPSRSPTGAIAADNTQLTLVGDTIFNRTPETGISVVQHDANAWSAPSFLRQSSSTNTKTSRSTSSSTDALPPALGKSKAANTNSAERGLRASLSRKASLTRNRLPRVDQNQDPTAPSVPLHPKKLAQAQKTPLAPSLTSSQSRPNKRRKDITSDTESMPELSRPHAKKRKVERTAQMKVGKVGQTTAENGEGEKLNGFSANLDGIVLAEQRLPLIDWWRLRDIMLNTARDRER
ncbi:hypothetical protein L208DRAFT_1409210 [Tricholoma matsutake]|nr:hypothetical protein L208DRAFT_1409210 [Tricholoma matsutake 945]